MGTRGAWARDFLVALGNANPSAKTVNLVAAWTKAENTEATFNPLATSLDYGDNTAFNFREGRPLVRNYKTRQQGIEATAITLRSNWPGYAKTLKGLQTDNAELALDGMLTPGMPWGTNFGTVAAYYRTSDVTGEALKSESSTADKANLTKADDTKVPTGTKSTNSNITAGLENTGLVTGDDIKSIAKIILGSGVAVTGVLLIILAIGKSDAAKTAIDVAKVAAI